jgi:hypothetical protein
MPTSNKGLPVAPPAEAFRNSVLSSLEPKDYDSSSNGARDEAAAASFKSPGKRPRSEISSSQEHISGQVDGGFVEDIDAPETVPPPPPVRRSSSFGGLTNQSSLTFGKPLVRRRSTLFDSLPGRSRGGSLMAVPETREAPSFFRRLSQNSTLLGDDLSTNLPNDNDDDDASLSHFTSTARRPSQPRGSLFGAVMEKLKVPAPGTPQPKQKTAQQQQKPPGFMTPSGKSIMNIVNQFVMSPFRFSSPNKAKRRLLSSPSAASRDDSATLSTPQRNKRARTDSLTTPSPRKKQSANEDSMSSLHDDDNWREAPLHGGQAEILDWTLSQKWRLECHPPDALLGMVHSREWRDTLGYWEYASRSDVVVLPSSRNSSDDSETNAAVPVKKSLTEKVATAKAAAEGISTVESGEHKQKDPAVQLATRLVRSVRASSSRGKPNSIISSTMSRPTLVADGRKDNEASNVSSSQQQIQEWKQSFRSLYFQWSQQVETEENVPVAILDYYFYCVSDDHVVLFRVDATADHFLPRVLVSSCGESFLQSLRDTGVDTMKVLEDPITHSNATKGSEKDDRQKPMSPTVKADLEALRKAQAYGEVAGADVSIKIKTKTKENKPMAQPKDLAITISGVDDVASFFEVYLNRLGWVKETIGDALLPRSLPKLISPREMGPFWHASLKSLETRPVKPSKEAQRTSGIVEIQGAVVLPSMIRRLVALSASKLSVLHSKSSGLPDAAPLTIRSPSREDPAAAKAGSHYVVLHAVEEEQTSLKTTKTPSRELRSAKRGVRRESILFNDIEKGILDEEAVGLTDKKLPECRSGTTLQLVVWDVSRSNVAACKVGALS